MTSAPLRSPALPSGVLWLASLVLPLAGCGGGGSAPVYPERKVKLPDLSNAGTLSGTVRFDGQDLKGLRVHQRARLGIGRTFQRVELFLGTSVRDHLLVADRAR